MLTPPDRFTFRLPADRGVRFGSGMGHLVGHVVPFTVGADVIDYTVVEVHLGDGGAWVDIDVQRTVEP